MSRLDTIGLRETMARDRSATLEDDRRVRAAQPLEQKVRLAIELYESAKRANPSWR